jgi:hypothetical protein
MKRLALVVLIAAALGCGSRPAAAPRLNLAVGQVASAPVWSPDRNCVAAVISDAEGHSPLTTTWVAVARRSDAGYRELRLPPPNERFSTFIETWEAPDVLRLRATTLEGDIAARYNCATGAVEVMK